MLRKTWISAERVFDKSANIFMTMFVFFLKGWVFPFKTKPTRIFFFKSSILTGVSMVTLGHLFQHLGHFRRSLRMANHRWVFIGEDGIYIYMTHNPCSWNNDIYIYMFSSLIFEHWLKPGRILAKTSGKTKLLGVRSGEICTGWIWMVCFMLDGFQEANGHIIIQTQTQPECFQTCKLLIRNLTLTMKTTLWPWPYPWTSEKWGMLIGIRIPMRCKIDIAIPTTTTNPYNPKYNYHWIREDRIIKIKNSIVNITDYQLTVFVSPLFALPHFNY